MDYNKIGNFIASERKAKNLTQKKLAEILFVSEKTISKWENGKGVPDTSILPKLCEVFKITINELLNGRRILDEKYKESAELKLIELIKQNELKNKKVYACTLVLTIVCLIFYFSVVLLSFLTLNTIWLISVINVIAFILLFISLYSTFKTEVDLSYYECKNCKYKFTPTYTEALIVPHMPKSKHLKCPKCGKRTWAKRVMNK